RKRPPRNAARRPPTGLRIYARRTSGLADVLQGLRHRHLVRAPARTDAEGRLVEHGLDARDLAVLDLEELGELPRPVDAIVVEERQRERDAALDVDGHEPPVAD